VLAGILGTGPAPLRFDIYGDTVAVAVRMAECSSTGCIVVSAHTNQLLCGEFVTERSGKANLKRIQGGMEFFSLKGRRSGRARVSSDTTQRIRPIVDIGAEHLSGAVLANAAFHSACDFGVLDPHRDKLTDSLLADIAAASAESVEGWTEPTLRWQHGLAPFVRCERCGLRFRRRRWEADYLLTGTQGRRKNHSRLLVATLLTLIPALWAVEAYSERLGGVSGGGTSSSSGQQPSDIVSMWLEYAMLGSPICALLLASLTKAYKRRADTMVAAAVVLSSASFALFIVGNAAHARVLPVRYICGLPIVYGYLGGYLRPVPAVCVCLISSAVLATSFWAAARDSTVAPSGQHDDAGWAAAAFRDTLLISGPLHLCGICASVSYERSRRLHYAWWSYFETLRRQDCGRSLGLLRLLVPAAIAEGALQTGVEMAIDCPHVTLAAVDVAGFANVAGGVGYEGGGGSVVALAFLRDAFSMAEIIADRHQVTLLRRRGTSLLAAARPPGSINSHALRGSARDPQMNADMGHGLEAQRLARFGVELIAAVRHWCLERWGPAAAADLKVGIRVGIGGGRVSAALVGAHRFGYDVWAAGPALAARCGGRCVHFGGRSD
jgi:class 3 adenylate cyclase